jgi:hypothetical protein
MDLSGLWQCGFARIGKIFSTKECEAICALYDHPESFRSRIDMARYRFGRGEYQYFNYPLPERIDALRHELYSKLAPVARDWMAALSLEAEYPDDLDAFLKTCHEAGQSRPTPLLLRYREGDFNCLHQDLYGEIVFPFQVVIGLSDNYEGGELLLVEQRPRAQSIGHAIRLQQGEGVAITTRYRPAKGSRGFHRTNMRHGVSPITRGERFTLGIIFHDAK